MTAKKLTKLLALYLPYLLLGLVATNFGEAWRLAEGKELGDKIMSMMLSVKLSDEKCDKWYRRFYYNLRLQMQEYYQHKAVIMDSYWNHHMEKSYGEADEV